MQCIESCRFFSFDYAVANKVDGVCSCSRLSAATVSGPLPHQCTDAMKHEIYSVAAITESPTCDHLYFRKHVYAPGDYKVGNMDASCKYSLNEVVGSAWVQTSEKLLRASLMFSDLRTRVSARRPPWVERWVNIITSVKSQVEKEALSGLRSKEL